MKARLIVNPTSGPDENSHLLADIVKALQDHGIRPEVCLTTPDEDGQGLAAQAVKDGTKLVIAAGGDGTISAVARGLFHTPAALGIIPLGTRNNIAGSLNIPKGLDQAAQILVEGETCSVDLGKAGNYYFMEVVGVGLEAVLIPYGEEVKRMGLLHSLSTAITGLKTFLHFQPHRLTLQLDGKKVLHPHSLQVNICNSPRYGMEFSLAPDAKMNDGKLDIVYLDNSTKWEFFRHFFSIRRGRRTPNEKMKVYHAARIEITSRKPQEVHADGLCLGRTPITVEVVPHAVQVRVPTPLLLEKLAHEQENRLIPDANKVAENPEPQAIVR